MHCTRLAIQLISICSPLTDHNIHGKKKKIQEKMHYNSICGKKNTQYTQCEAAVQHINSK